MQIQKCTNCKDYGRIQIGGPSMQKCRVCKGTGQIASAKTSRKSVMKQLREAINIRSAHTFSDKRKKTQRLKLWAVRNVIDTVSDIQTFINEEDLPGIKIKYCIGHSYYPQMGSRASIVLNFDNDLYN